MLAKGMVELKVSDTSQVGTPNFNEEQVVVVLTTRFFVDDDWVGLTSIPLPATSEQTNGAALYSN